MGIYPANTWDDNVRDVMGPMSRSTVYEMLAAHTLTLGKKPRSPSHGQ